MDAHTSSNAGLSRRRLLATAAVAGVAAAMRLPRPAAAAGSSTPVSAARTASRSQGRNALFRSRTLIRALVVVVALMLVAFAPAHAQDPSPPVGIDSLCGPDALTMSTAQQTLPADQATALDDLLRMLVTMPEDSLSLVLPNPPSAGAGMFVETPQGRYLRTIGVADVHTCAPLRPQMPFAIGSNTKMMTAAIIYQLQEEGRLSTTDQVSVYLPDEMAQFPRSANATIDQLLSHTAGLPDYYSVENPEFLVALFEDPESGVLERAYTPQELIASGARIQDDPGMPTFAPGDVGQWRYSSTGYILLGLLIEKVTGKSYEEALTTHIFEPLGLTHTVLVPDVAPANLGLPSTYLASPFTRDTSGWNYSHAWSAGAVVSTADELATFVKALFSGRLFRSPKTLIQMQARAAPCYPGETDDWYHAHGSNYSDGFWGHGGQTLGFVSDPGYNPDTETTIVVWQNVTKGHGSFGVLHAGHALGLTRSWDDIVQEILGNQTAAAAGCAP